MGVNAKSIDPLKAPKKDKKALFPFSHLEKEIIETIKMFEISPIRLGCPRISSITNNSQKLNPNWQKIADRKSVV